MARFIYEIRPQTLVPDNEELTFGSDVAYRPGDVFEHGGRELFVDCVGYDVITKWAAQPDSMTISKTLHCRRVVA